MKLNKIITFLPAVVVYRNRGHATFILVFCALSCCKNVIVLAIVIKNIHINIFKSDLISNVEHRVNFLKNVKTLQLRFTFSATFLY